MPNYIRAVGYYTVIVSHNDRSLLYRDNSDFERHYTFHMMILNDQYCIAAIYIC